MKICSCDPYMNTYRDRQTASQPTSQPGSLKKWRNVCWLCWKIWLTVSANYPSTKCERWERRNIYFPTQEKYLLVEDVGYQGGCFFLIKWTLIGKPVSHYWKLKKIWYVLFSYYQFNYHPLLLVIHLPKYLPDVSVMSVHEPTYFYLV